MEHLHLPSLSSVVLAVPYTSSQRYSSSLPPILSQSPILVHDHRLQPCSIPETQKIHISISYSVDSTAVRTIFRIFRR